MKPQTILIISLMIFFSFSFVLAEENVSLNESLKDVVVVDEVLDNVSEVVSNETVVAEIISNETVENVTIENKTISENSTLDLEKNETIENVTIENKTVENSTLDLEKNETWDNETELNESEIKEEENETEVVEEEGLLESLSLGIQSLAKSVSHRFNMFVLGLSVKSNIYQGYSFTHLLSFSDGMTGDAETSSYSVNVGPLGSFTNYKQCFRETCSQLNYSCDSWDDTCGGILNCGNCNSDSFCDVGKCILDVDGDKLDDVTDSLIGNSDKVKINESSNLSQSFSDIQELKIYEDTDLVVKMLHNFTAGKIYLDKIEIVTGENFVITDFSNQLLSGETKTLYIQDKDFEKLCVKDAEIASVNEISKNCDGDNEYDFTSCIGGSFDLGKISCVDLGDRFMISNLKHSAVRGISKEKENVKDLDNHHHYSRAPVIQMGEIDESNFSGELLAGYRGNFTFENKEYKIFLRMINRETEIVRFDVYSDKQSIEIIVGENRTIDLNKDGKLDVSLLVTSIVEDGVAVNIELMDLVGNEKVEIKDEKFVAIAGDMFENELICTWMGTICIACVVFIYFLLWKIKNQKEKKSSKKKRK